MSNYKAFENRGLSYAATAMEALLCRDQEIVVVGGGNSAGQASVFPLRRGEPRSSHRSRSFPPYFHVSVPHLAHRAISPHYPPILMRKLCASRATALWNFVTWMNRKSGEGGSEADFKRFRHDRCRTELRVGYTVRSRLDEKGFVLTGGPWGFEPTSFATSIPGIYAVGDIRAESVKRGRIGGSARAPLSSRTSIATWRALTSLSWIRRVPICRGGTLSRAHGKHAGAADLTCQGR